MDKLNRSSTATEAAGHRKGSKKKKKTSNHHTATADAAGCDVVEVKASTVPIRPQPPSPLHLPLSLLTVVFTLVPMVTSHPLLVLWWQHHWIP